MLSTAVTTTNTLPKPTAIETSKALTTRALLTPTSPRRKEQPNTLDLEDAVEADVPLLGDALADLWDQEPDSAALGRLFGDVSLQPLGNHHPFDVDAAQLASRSSTSEPRDGFSAPDSPMLETHYTFDHPPNHEGHQLPSYHDFGLSPVPLPSNNTADISNPMDIDLFPDPENPGPLIDLTTLLAEMSHYENQLSKLPPSGTAHDLDDYPIGDALFLSQRFHLIIAEYTSASGQPLILQPASPPTSLSSTSSTSSPCTSSISSHGTPTAHHPPLDMFLPTITCYLTLTRIYSSIFTFLLAHLSHPAAAHHSDMHSAGSLPPHPAHHNKKDRMHAYRGRRLGQLKETCLCAAWDPVPRARNAVAMLLASLGGAEGVLALPADIRVVTTGMIRGGGGGGGGKGEGSERERRGLPFEEDGRLYRAVREQVRELRGKVEVVDGLLKEILYG